PSSGKAGTTLITSTSALIVASQLSHTSAGVARAPLLATATSKKLLLPAITRPATTHVLTTPSVTAGPAAATRNSTPGLGDSVVRVMPPSAHSSIPATVRPLRRATNACPSSCITIETKNDSTDATATAYAVVRDPPSSSWNGPVTA